MNKEEKEIDFYASIIIEMYKIEEMGKQISFSELVRSLDGVLTKSEVAECLDFLEDYSVVCHEYRETSPGRAGRVYSLTDIGKSIVEESKKEINFYASIIIEMHKIEEMGEQILLSRLVESLSDVVPKEEVHIYLGDLKNLSIVDYRTLQNKDEKIYFLTDVGKIAVEKIKKAKFF